MHSLCPVENANNNSPQAKQTRIFYTLVVIGVEAFSAVFGLHDLDVGSPQVMGQRSSKARPSAHGVACPPQWLPVLLCIATPSPSPQPPSPSPLLPGFVEKGMKFLLGGSDMSFLMAGGKARGKFFNSLD